ncbi:DUF4129 domain-containing protein [Pontimicrobium aquaticum]|uniref:DUF4129 domain-containing protein n=1 Tax=Pontimicrobium aquaticum TaxID=2565367 RepID=A0A4U0EW89_9FLAO|nr:DUF4129 domain-containing protein [Pontimicrobium aquaticum]TJY36231.1 DUF4129 domain-containing protein [Pontimicrobium aquaticum]
MNKRIGLHIVLFMFVCFSFQSIQAVTHDEFIIVNIENDTLNIDTSDIKPRLFNNLKEKYSNDAFIYERTVENSGWWTRFKQWLSDKFRSLFNIKNAGQASKITDLAIKIGGVLLFVLVVYFIFRAIINKEGAWVFGKSSDKSIIPITDIEANIHATNFKKLIDEAETNSNYRLAIRYYYLWLLKNLSAAEIIHYDVEKTNNDYRNEIKIPKVKEDFAYTSYLYNYIWYGEFDVNNEQFSKAKHAFSTFLNSIKA